MLDGMCCCGGGAENRRRPATLVLKMEQLRYDVENNCFIEGTVCEPGNDHVRHTVQDVGQEGNADRMLRMIELTHAAVVEMLYPYTKEDVWRDILSDEPDEREVYVVEMLVPETFSQTTLNLLGKLVHEWIVCKVTADWLSIAKPEASARWEAKAEALAREIDRVKNRRRGVVRRRMHPF